MLYNFDEVINRQGTFSLKWDSGEFLKRVGLTDRFDSQTIPLHSADMDFRCALPISEALKRVADHNIYGYTAVFPEGCGMPYYDAVTGWHYKRTQWSIKPEEIIYVNGTLAAIDSAIETFTKAGDGVLINRPIYRPFTEAIEDRNRVVVNSQLVNTDGYYTVDFEDFERKAAEPRTTLFILCHPHNPTGRLWTDDELLTLASLCRKHGVTIISDEIHGDLLRKEHCFHPLAQVSGPEGIITCTSPNKTFNMAGLQAANIIIGDSPLRERFKKGAGLHTPNPFTAAAVMAAYNEGEEWLAQLREYLDGNIDMVLSFLKAQLPKVKCHRPEGTYILWLDFRDSGFTPDEVHRKIYREANVVMERGTIFDPDLGLGFERICVPTRRALLQEALERIAAEFNK